jgi:hypothetical protein
LIQPEHVRIAGVVVAALFAAYGVVRYRRGGSRFDLLLALLIASGVALVSVVPQVGEVFTGLLGLENRAFALLSFASLLLFALFLYLLTQVREANRRSGEIVTGIAVRQYEERHLAPECPGEEAEKRKKLLIVVPAYNEEGGIRDVLRRIPDEVLGYKIKTVVVDDGSADATVAIAREEGVAVASHVVNRGQGDALRTGFQIAQLEKADIVINLDADGQYRPEEMDRLVRPIMEDEADFVLGSRFLGFYEEAGSVRHVGVAFFSRMISLLSGTRITDSTNGFRAIRGSELAKMDLREDRFNATEIILEGLKNKLRFEEVPVSMLRRAEGESKKPKRLAYPLGVARVIISTWLR